MDREEVLNKVIEIARDVFDNDEIVLTEETTAADVEEWDSLSHITLVNDIEKTFGVRFTLAEISKTKNVGEFVNVLMQHLAKK